MKHDDLMLRNNVRWRQLPQVQKIKINGWEGEQESRRAWIWNQKDRFITIAYVAWYARTEPLATENKGSSRADWPTRKRKQGKCKDSLNPPREICMRNFRPCWEHTGAKFWEQCYFALGLHEISLRDEIWSHGINGFANNRKKDASPIQKVEWLQKRLKILPSHPNHWFQGAPSWHFSVCMKYFQLTIFPC